MSMNSLYQKAIERFEQSVLTPIDQVIIMKVLYRAIIYNAVKHVNVMAGMPNVSVAITGFFRPTFRVGDESRAFSLNWDDLHKKKFYSNNTF